ARAIPVLPHGRAGLRGERDDDLVLAAANEGEQPPAVGGDRRVSGAELALPDLPRAGGRPLFREPSRRGAEVAVGPAPLRPLCGGGAREQDERGRTREERSMNLESHEVAGFRFRSSRTRRHCTPPRSSAHFSQPWISTASQAWADCCGSEQSSPCETRFRARAAESRTSGSGSRRASLSDSATLESAMRSSTRAALRRDSGSSRAPSLTR